MSIDAGYLRFTFLVLVTFAGGGIARGAASSQPTIEFNHDIRPILSNHCFTCHGPDAQQRKGDPPLRLDVREGLFSQRDSSAPVIPGKPDESIVMMRVTSDDDEVRMPPIKS